MSKPLALAVALVCAGCATTPQNPRFSLQRLASDAAAPVAATTVTAAVPAAAPLPPGAGGSVVINFASVLPRARKLLATMADVDHVKVTLKVAGQPDQVQTVAKAAITNGQATATFDGVQPGSATFVVDVFDAGGDTIGHGTGAVTVTAGQTASVQVPVQLSPHIIDPAPASGGGGSEPTTGSAQANVSLQDGQDANPLVLDKTWNVAGGALWELVSAQDGTFWATQRDYGGMMHLDASGAVLQQYDPSDLLWGPLHMGAHGEVYGSTLADIPLQVSVGKVASGTLTTYRGAGGTAIPYGFASALASDNSYWVGYGRTPYRVDASGSAGFATATGLPAGSEQVHQLAADAQGHVYALLCAESPSILDSVGLVKYSADGTSIAWYRPTESTLGAISFIDVDQQGQLWAYAYGKLARLGGDGVATAIYPAPTNLGNAGNHAMPGFGDHQGMLFDPAGHVYLYYVDPTTADRRIFLAKFGNDGALLGTYYMPDVTSDDVNAIKGDGGSDLVVLTQDHGQRFYHLP